MTNKKDDEVELNLSWLKNIFKKGGEEHETHKSSHKDGTHREDMHTDDVAISWNPKAVWHFLVVHHAAIFILIAIGFSAYLRATPWEMPITDGWARDTLTNNVRGSITAQIQRQYPNLPVDKRNELIQVDLQRFLQENKAQLDEQVKSQSEYFKSRYRTPDGDHMLLDIDSYAYFRETWNLVQYGHLGNAIINGTVLWDTFVLAPLGIPPGDNLHIHLGAWMYGLWHFFDPSVTVFKTMFWLPFLIALIAPIPAFFIGRKFAGPIGGFFAALYMAINPATLARTSAGVPDTDVYSIVFPLLVIWAYLEAYDGKTLRTKLVWSGLAGLLSGLYAWAWSGWWHVFWIALAGTIAYMILRASISYRREPATTLKSLKTTALVLVVYIFSSGFFVTIFREFNFFIEAAKQPFLFIAIQAAAKQTLWPNVYTTVAELNTVDLQGILGSIGGWTYAIIALIGIGFAMTKKDEHNHYDFKFGLILLFWIASTVYASTKGVRFLMLLSLPITICFASFVGNLCEVIGKWLYDHMGVPSAKNVIAVILFIMLIFSNQWPSAKAVSKQNIPLISDAWWSSLTHIRDVAEPNAILTSWWDFGHWFKAVAQRPTTFDGGTQNTPVAHWVGKMLLDSDEKEAVGILRMLNCGSNRAADLLEQEFGNDTVKAVDLLYSIFKLDLDAARVELLKSNVSDPDHILEYTHCNPPESFVIASDDMIGKGGVWAHFGSWNFTRANIYINTKNTSRRQSIEYVQSLGLDEAQATRLVDELRSLHDDRSINSWIAPWPGYAGGSGCKKQDDIVRCQNGVEVNLTNWSPNQNNGVSSVKRLVYVENGELRIKSFNQSVNELDGLLLPSSTSDYTMIFSQYPLGTGLFTRMYFLEGLGLQYFDKFYDQSGVTGARVITYRVDWDGNSTNYPYSQYNFTTNVTQVSKGVSLKSKNKSVVKNATI